MRRWRVSAVCRPFVTGLLALALVAGAAAQSRPGGAAVPVTLAEVYRSLEDRNPGLEAARQMSIAAAARIKPASTLPDPQIQLGLMNRNLPGLGLQDPLGMNQVQIMQMVPIAGQLGLAGRAARALAGAAGARAADLGWELRSRAAMAFYELYQADHSIEVDSATQRLLRDIAALARTMYSVGRGRQADVLRAQVEIDRMSEEIARMRAMRDAAASRLNALLDRPFTTAVPTPALPRFPEVLPDGESLERQALAGRPMLAAGALELEAAAAAQQRARREIWPDLQVGVQYGQRPMVEGTERMVSLMLGFSVPLWAGRRQLQMRRETEAMRTAAESELRAMQAETRGRLGELTAAVRRARALRTLYLTTILPQAEATVSAALAAYQAGEVDLPMLLDARMTINRYRQQVIQLDAEEGTTLAELEMLLGRPLFDAGITEPRLPPGGAR
jgi:cobalt-zinc-cadmium efflux system outer membrane protein